MREAFCPPPKSCRHCFFFDEKAGPLLFIAAIVDLQSSSCFDAAAADQLNSLAPMILFHSDLDPTDTLRVAAPAPLQGPVLQVIWRANGASPLDYSSELFASPPSAQNPCTSS
uniref:Uncharacterized protein n=1 Tax=Aegilops tauschii subsp. strangulata TaxID=200361 RepID=A0A453DXM6_AEGTS